MAKSKARRRGLSDALLANGLLQTFGLDAVLALGVVLIGVGLYRLQPDAVWIYAGLLAFILWWSIGQARARDPKKPNAQ